jgi:cell division transport system permease protein
MSDHSQSPIIPKSIASMRSFTVTMTVMCFLACLAIAALLLIDRAVEDWSRGLQSEVTVQIRETQNDDMQKKIEAAEMLIGATRGVQHITVLTREEGMKLLQPWLGEAILETLPVPRLIRVNIDQANQPDFEALQKTLKEKVKGASLDTHQRWATELTRMATTLSVLSWSVLILICLSAVAAVVFATRAVLAANRHIVDVLRLVGARNNFIAHQIDQLFLRAGAASGLLGVGLAAATFASLGFSGEPAVNGVAAAAQNLIYLPDQPLWQKFMFVALVPACATLLALFTSRITLLRMLKEQQ